MIPGKQPSHPSFKRSFFFAFQGLRTAVIQERNIKVMLGGFALAVGLGALLRIDLLSWAIVLLCCGCVLAAELFNTALEAVVDMVSPEFHPLAGKAKDISAAATWVLSALVAVVGALVYLNALLKLIP